ncbi:MAG: ATP-binding protein [Candidatus Kariarchaeaceae archaeon]
MNIDGEYRILSVTAIDDSISFDVIPNIFSEVDSKTTISSIVALIDEERQAVKTLVGRKIAHDIANPITAISMNLEFLKDQIFDLIKDNEQIIDSLDGSLNSVNLIRDLLDSYRTDVPMGNKPSQCQLNQMINLILKRFLFSLPENVLLVWELGDDIVIELRELTLWRGMMNLLVNALESIGDENVGIIQIRTFPDGSFINLEISDSGDEFNQNLIHKFLKPFFSTKENHLGLGMSLTDLIAGNSGGTIDIQREREQTIVNWKIPVSTIS